MYSEDQILSVLKKVIHPEKGKDIITLGMVAEIKSGSGGISMVLVPEKSNDPFISSIRSTIVKNLKEAFGQETEITAIEIRPRVIVGKHEKPEGEILSGIKNKIAVASGKGGVGKTTIAVNLAVALALKNFKVGLLDADVFGPSVPKMFGAEKYRPEVKRENNNDIIVPLTKFGVKVLSTGFFIDPADALVWRGPMASNFLKQLMTQGEWGELDFILFDLPPGTSDIHLTLVQEVAVTGAIVVSTPQDVALADAVKGISMFRSDKINVPVLGLVENMAWFTPAELPGNRYYIFGREGVKKLAEQSGVPLLGQIPIVQGICESGDNGNPVALENSPAGEAFRLLADEVVNRVNIRNIKQEPTVKLKINK